MRQSSVSFLFVMLCSAQADTLVFRNGTKVTGAWIDLDGGQVTFSANNHVQTYPRSDISAIIFDRESGPAPAPQVPRTDSNPSSSSLSATVSAVEPEILNVVYYLDAGKNTLTTLERQTAKTSSTLFHVSGEVKSERSPVRINVDRAQNFIVSLAAGVDPSKYELFLMEVIKGKRRTVVASTKPFSAQVAKNTIAMTATRYGDAAYKLSPVQKLPPGEYCLGPSTSNDCFCFGVDVP